MRLYGKLISVEMFIDSGNSWLGSKHHAEPTLERKKSLGRKNKYPKWIKEKNKFLYESNWNFVSHFMDLLEFFNFKKIKTKIYTLTILFFLMIGISSLGIQFSFIFIIFLDRNKLSKISSAKVSSKL